MTKTELWKLWFPRMYRGEKAEAEKIREQFFDDLENWYYSRHEKELNAIKKEVVKSLAEMNNAFDTNNNTDSIRNCTRFGKDGDCLARTICECCDNPPTRLLKGYDCYD